LSLGIQISIGRGQGKAIQLRSRIAVGKLREFLELLGGEPGLLRAAPSDDIDLPDAAFRQRLIDTEPRHIEAVLELADRAYRRPAFHEFLAASDYVVLVAPLTPETRGMLGEPELHTMKPEAWLVNLGRGSLIQEPAFA